MSAGLHVSIVLGMDGLVAVRDLQQFNCILLGDEGSVADQRSAVRWLKEESTNVPPVIALGREDELVEGADYQISTNHGGNWLEALTDYIRRSRKLA